MNLTRRGGEDLLPLAAAIPIQIHVITFPLSDTDGALDILQLGELHGAVVLIP